MTFEDIDELSLAQIFSLLYPRTPNEPKETDKESYHKAEVNHDGVWKGLTFRDMPGWDQLDQKLNFFLFRRNLYQPNERVAL